mgnify:CR=1 FL=1
MNADARRAVILDELLHMSECERITGGIGVGELMARARGHKRGLGSSRAVEASLRRLVAQRKVILSESRGSAGSFTKATLAFLPGPCGAGCPTCWLAWK